LNKHEQYLIQERARMDKWQTMFDKGYIVANFRTGTVEEFFLNSERQFICPFCLTPNTQPKFLLKEKNHYMAKCPECKQNVHFKTLFSIMKMDNGLQFADFVFGYRLSGFWDKIKPDFKEWNNRLYSLALGFGTEFWNRYKELKGDETNEETE